MNLTEYEKTKFELAEVLRAAVIASGAAMSDAPDEIRDLFSRLAEDRFNLAVVGRFNRGKTSLMNALIETKRLPTGIVPLTSVITAVSYGSQEEVIVEYKGSRLPYRISLDHLADYVTQQGNPGNQKNVAVASVRLPCELLRRGFHFIDTPGIGSSIRENTATTEQFLPEADAFVLVRSYDSPLSNDETALLQRIVPTGKKVFFILNKMDIVSTGDKRQVQQYVHSRLAELFGARAPSTFSVSALDALNAGTGEWTGAGNGVGELRDQLVAFLIAEKQGRFLANMLDRIAAAIRVLPNSAAAVARLNELMGVKADDAPTAATAISGEIDIATCSICDAIERAVFSFLAQYQYDIATNDKVRADLAERGGLCAFHTWQYHALASTQGTSLAFSSVLDRLAVRLRETADHRSTHINDLRVTEDRCPVCRVRAETERRTATNLKSKLARPVISSSMPSLCLSHVGLLIRNVGNADISRRLLIREAELYERLSEDMRRYALKIDGVSRHLVSDEEQTAARLALSLLVGNYGVNAARRIG